MGLPIDNKGARASAWAALRVLLGETPLAHGLTYGVCVHRIQSAGMNVYAMFDAHCEAYALAHRRMGGPEPVDPHAATYRARSEPTLMEHWRLGVAELAAEREPNRRTD